MAAPVRSSFELFLIIHRYRSFHRRTGPGYAFLLLAAAWPFGHCLLRGIHFYPCCKRMLITVCQSGNRYASKLFYLGCHKSIFPFVFILSGMTATQFKEEVYSMSDGLFRFAGSLLGNSDDAADVVQNIMMMLWQRKDTIHEIDSIKAFAFRSVRNECLNRFRRTEIRNGHHKLIRMYAPVSTQPDSSDTRLINTLIAGLPEKQRAVVIHLRDVEGYSNAEIADMLGVTADAVRANLVRARQTLRNKLLQIEEYEQRQLR